AEKLVLDDMAANGTTPIAIEAFSWLGRGAVAAKNYDVAMTYAARTYEIVEEQLKTRKLDDEARLPIALGAAIEVTALATAGQGRRSEAVLYLRRELDTYKDTSIVERLNKNVNLLSLEGSPAFPVDSPKWIGAAPPALAALKGKPVILYLWAHWCPDCKAQGPVLRALLEKYKSTGLTLVAPTKFYGYVAKRQPAGPDEELTYLTAVRDSDYPWMKNLPVPISEQIFAQYGVSTTPTLVLIDRAGNVSKYHPGQLTVEQLEPLIQKIIAPAGSAR
ncbi:MAG: TlpA disulfide reductase family protein, partial [Acidobacteriota bacterium]|nr:TlpA disulfide reductase family protein [Acidobacteriota bacterium]